MGKTTKPKKTRTPAAPPAAPARSYSPEAQELRALLRRVPDGFQATLNALAARPAADRERVMAELARGMGKEILPLFRAAALGAPEDLACSACRTLPEFGTRAAGDVLVEVYRARSGTERAEAALKGARALLAQGISLPLSDALARPEPLQYQIRETLVSAPDGVGSRSIAARLQDQYGVWYAILLLWNDQAGVKDGFMRPVSRHEWQERMERVEDRGLDWVTCPPDYARWQIAIARDLNAKTGFPVGDSLKEWDAHVGPPPEGYQPPDPTAEVRAASEAEQLQWRSDGSKLFEMGDVKRWFLEAADCVEWSRRWTDLQNRLRYRPEDARTQEELVQLVQSATQDLLGPALIELYRARLLDLARVCAWRGDELTARRAAAAVVALDQQLPLAEQPFFNALVQHSLMATEGLLQRGDDLQRTRYRPLRRYQGSGW